MKDWQPVSFAFIDGMHLFENALQDFINVELWSNEASIIAIDDVFPRSQEEAKRERETKKWCGDVWRVLACLAETRPDLIMIGLDSCSHGDAADRQSQQR